MATEVAVGLHRAGVKTLFVDLDPQAIERTGFSGFEPRKTYMDLVPSWLLEDKVDADELRQAVYSTRGGVDMLFSPTTISPQDV